MNLFLSINGFIIGCLLICQSTYAVKKPFLCRSFFVHSFVSHMKTSQHRSKEDFTPPRYVSGSVLEPNDVISIRQALSVQHGDGAAIVNINTFTLEIAKKMRQAIISASEKNSKQPWFQTKPMYFHYHPEKRGFISILPFVSRKGSFEKDWRDFKAWLRKNTQIISSEEIDQFQKEVDEYVDQIKQVILEVDGKGIELEQFDIRLENGFVVEEGHEHYEFGRLPFGLHVPNYITATVAPIGLSTFYTRSSDITGDRMVSYSGHTVVMTERDRIRKIKEPGFLPFHGTPGISKERLFFLFSFKASK